jgi:hypothetical protein
LLLQQLWQEIDEQALPPLLRRELMMQGFRAGILGSIGSPALTKFLQNSADFNAEEVQKMNSHEREIHAADILRKTAATRQYRTLVPDMRALVRIFDNPLPDVFLFWNEDSLYCGQTYRDATGILCVQAKADKDGGAAFDIVPELEYGKLEQRIRHHQGMIIQETSRPRKTFPALTVSQRLLQGQWILIGAVSREYTGLGNTFFVRAGAEQEQRLFAVRFVQAAPAETQGQSSTYSPHVIPERN